MEAMNIKAWEAMESKDVELAPINGLNHKGPGLSTFLLIPMPAAPLL
jgi:hypothetical protein